MPRIDPDIEAFIAAFLKGARAQRWRSVLEMKPARWSGVSTWDLWDHRFVRTECCGDLLGGMTELRAKLEQYEDAMVTVFAVGHAAGERFRAKLANVFAEELPIECVISVVPGKLAVAINHDDQFRLLDNR